MTLKQQVDGIKLLLGLDSDATAEEALELIASLRKALAVAI